MCIKFRLRLSSIHYFLNLASIYLFPWWFSTDPSIYLSFKKRFDFTNYSRIIVMKYHFVSRLIRKSKLACLRPRRKYNLNGIKSRKEVDKHARHLTSAKANVAKAKDTENDRRRRNFVDHFYALVAHFGHRAVRFCNHRREICKLALFAVTYFLVSTFVHECSLLIMLEGKKRGGGGKGKEQEEGEGEEEIFMNSSRWNYIVDKKEWKRKKKKKKTI